VLVGTGADVGATVVGVAGATVVVPMVDAPGTVPLVEGPVGRTVVTFAVDADGTIAVVGVPIEVGMRDDRGATKILTTEPRSTDVPGAGSMRVVSSFASGSVSPPTTTAFRFNRLNVIRVSASDAPTMSGTDISPPERPVGTVANGVESGALFM
jgi:hypothetical protein